MADTKRPREGNVIYANFGARTRVNSADEIPRRPVATQLCPVANRLSTLTLALADQGRINRGRQYARAGNVVELDIKNGAAHARVAGSQNSPFTTSLILPYRTADDLSTLTRTIVESHNGLARMRRGDVDDEVLDLLLAAEPQDVRFACDCPDHAGVCKHAIALADRLISRIDADPSLAFHLRGMTMQSVEQAALVHAKDVAQESSTAGSERFWEAGDLPELPRPKVAPALDDSDVELLHKAMRVVSFTSIDQLRAVSDLEDLYHHLTK
ncbi:hypothetical protein [Corynebacterium tapiri]|uniref:SWIM-type domain-containing protein n=1 Tax=Corynebacterium tapiri TaxID=1448266 RepID=A0A5C4U623_9CORY|nr:hypothetical protein [Corynebacterium tapiri]TNL99698.1 hypothetical protein FHE74_01250 [Corynebacterium tapiri]